MALFTWLRKKQPKAQKNIRNKGRRTLNAVESLERREVMSVNHLQLALQMANSDEYFGNTVRKDYQQYLGRSVDDAGLNFWVSQIRNGKSFEQVEAEFIGTKEYIANHGGTGEAWVNGMYQDLLGRSPDDQGLKYWTHSLANGADPTSVARGFAGSLERKGIEVQNIYQQALGRDAGASEVNYWTSQFGRGMKSQDISAGFIGSDEYYRNFGRSNDAYWLNSASVDLFHRLPSSNEQSKFLGISTQDAKHQIATTSRGIWDGFLNYLDESQPARSEIYHNLKNVLQSEGPASALAYLGAEAGLYISGANRNDPDDYGDQGQSLASALIEANHRSRFVGLGLDTFFNQLDNKTASIGYDLLSAGLSGIEAYRDARSLGPQAALISGLAAFDAEMIGNIVEAGKLLADLGKYTYYDWTHESPPVTDVGNLPRFDTGFSPMPGMPGWNIDADWLGIGSGDTGSTIYFDDDAPKYSTGPVYWSPYWDGAFNGSNQLYMDEGAPLGGYTDWDYGYDDGYSFGWGNPGDINNSWFMDDWGPSIDWQYGVEPGTGYGDGYNWDWGTPGWDGGYDYSTVWDDGYNWDYGYQFDDGWSSGDFYNWGSWNDPFTPGFFDNLGDNFNSGGGSSIYFDDNAPKGSSYGWDSFWGSLGDYGSGSYGSSLDPDFFNNLGDNFGSGSSYGSGYAYDDYAPKSSASGYGSFGGWEQLLLGGYGSSNTAFLNMPELGNY